MEWVALDAASRVTLEDGRVLTRCDQCRQMWADRGKPLEAPCAECRVDLAEENYEVAEVYQAVRYQTVVTPLPDGKQVVTLNIPAVKVLMDLFGVRDQRTCLARVLGLWHELEAQRRE